MKYHVSFDIEVPEEVKGLKVSLEDVLAWLEFELGATGQLKHQPLSHTPLEAVSNSVLVDEAY